MKASQAKSLALVGLGALFLSEREAERLAKQLIESHKESEAEGRKFMSKLNALVEREREDFMQLAGYNREKAAGQVIAFERKIADLEAKLAQLKKKKTTGKSKRKRK